MTYVAQILVKVAERDLAWVEVRPEVMQAYDREVDAEHEQVIWTHPGMTTWYRNAAGRVVLTIPFRGVDFWARTSELDLDEYEVSSRASAAVG